MLLHSCPDIYKSFSFKKLVKHHRVTLEEKIITAKRVLTDELNENANISYDSLEINFKASRTAINNLNFISKKNSDSLKELKIEDPLLVDLIKLIYILSNESFKQIKKEKLLVNLHEKIFPKLKIDHISKI